jgi:DNA-binding GntR family transcriptional regulator
MTAETPAARGGSATASEEVVALLRAEILAGAVLPGTRLTAESVASRYAVSPMPVREALRVLEAEGLVEMLPRRGARVVATDTDFIRNVYDVREALEGMLAERCAERARPAEAAAIRELVARHGAAVAEGSIEEVVALDRSLHLEIARIAANPQAQRAITIGRGLLEALRRGVGYAAPRLARIVQEHHALAAAISAGDARTAGLVARLHAIGAREDLLAALAAARPSSVGPRQD